MVTIHPSAGQSRTPRPRETADKVPGLPPGSGMVHVFDILADCLERNTFHADNSIASPHPRLRRGASPHSVRVPSGAPWHELNGRHPEYKTGALPDELERLLLCCWDIKLIILFFP